MPSSTCCTCMQRAPGPPRTWTLSNCTLKLRSDWSPFFHFSECLYYGVSDFSKASSLTCSEKQTLEKGIVSCLATYNSLLSHLQYLLCLHAANLTTTENNSTCCQFSWASIGCCESIICRHFILAHAGSSCEEAVCCCSRGARHCPETLQAAGCRAGSVGCPVGTVTSH